MLEAQHRAVNIGQLGVVAKHHRARLFAGPREGDDGVCRAEIDADRQPHFSV
jgi:hypothetical protein